MKRIIVNKAHELSYELGGRKTIESLQITFEIPTSYLDKIDWEAQGHQVADAIIDCASTAMCNEIVERMIVRLEQCDALSLANTTLRSAQKAQRKWGRGHG